MIFSFKKMTIGMRIGVGMGIVLLFLLVLAVVSSGGMSSTVSDAEEVIYGNELDAKLTQFEIEQLNFSTTINKYLNDKNIQELGVGLELKESNFGKWLYGVERRKAEELIDGLGPMFGDIEDKYAVMYEAANEINSVYQYADVLLPGIFADAVNDLTNWSNELYAIFLFNKQVFDANTDLKKTDFGQWIDSTEAKALYKSSDAKFKKEFDLMKKNINDLYASVASMQIFYTSVTRGYETKLREFATYYKDFDSKLLKAIMTNQTDLADVEMAISPVDDYYNSEEYQNYISTYALTEMAFDELGSYHKSLKALVEDIKTVRASKSLQEGQKLTQIQKIYDDEIVGVLANIDMFFMMGIMSEGTTVDSNKAALDVLLDSAFPLLSQTVKNLDNLKKMAEHRLKGMNAGRDIYANDFLPAVDDLRRSFNAVKMHLHDNIMTQDKLLSTAQGTKNLLTFLGVVAFAISIFFAFVIASGIVKILKRLVVGLTEGANQTANASSQVSSASEHLSQGATTQAASLEEISSSLDQMLSMTKRNADNASQANQMAQNARDAAQKGNHEMEGMTSAMHMMNESSDKISKIIKTIEEIAFQTNLLALNAAVEAARAGEHGKGFAVVADEVRNLAQRAAGAARDTAMLIEDNISKVREGSSIVQQAAESLNAIVDNSKSVADIIAEIAAASREQSDGIAHITKAVSHMDQVTQQNAAAAEESASSSKELADQASYLQGMVSDLQALIGGVGTQGYLLGTDNAYGKQTIDYGQDRRTIAEPQQEVVEESSQAVYGPEDLIPFDDEDSMEDF